MLKKLKISMTGFVVSFFAFAMLSNCYCLPAFSPSSSATQMGIEGKMTSHCDHHSQANQKSQDCSPRYVVDDILRLADKIEINQKVVTYGEHAFQSIETKPSYSGEAFDFSPKLFLSSPPAIYIQVQSFLI